MLLIQSWSQQFMLRAFGIYCLKWSFNGLTKEIKTESSRLHKLDSDWPFAFTLHLLFGSLINKSFSQLVTPQSFCNKQIILNPLQEQSVWVLGGFDFEHSRDCSHICRALFPPKLAQLPERAILRDIWTTSNNLANNKKKLPTIWWNCSSLGSRSRLSEKWADLSFGEVTCDP